MDLLKNYLVITSILLLSFSSNAQNYYPCPNNTVVGFEPLFQHGDYGYYLSDESMTWENAATACEAQGGKLATIHNQYLNTILRNAIGNRSVYIGYNDLENEGTFTWHSGETTSYDKLVGSNSLAGDFVSLNFWNANWSLNRAPTQRHFLMEIFCPVVLEELPDLQTSEIIIPISGNQNETITIEFLIDNYTENDTPNEYGVKFYWSLDAQLSENDIAAGEITLGSTPANSSVPFNCADCVTIPENIIPGNYFLLIEVDADDNILELEEDNNISFSENIMSIQGAAFSDPCQIYLGNFETVRCLEFNDDGSILLIAETSSGSIYENHYSNQGALESSELFSGGSNYTINNNEIVNTNIMGDLLSITSIDPNLVSLYTTGQNEFEEVVRSTDGTFWLIGRIVGPSPAPWTPNSPTEESTQDELFLYHLDANGNEIGQFQMDTITYSGRDILYLGLDFLEYVGIIPHANGDVEIMLKRNTSLVGWSGYNFNNYLYDNNTQTFTITHPTGFSIYNGGTNRWISNELCHEGFYKKTTYGGTSSSHGSNSTYIESTLDYTVSPIELKKRNFRYYANVYGQGEETYYLVEPNINGTELQFFRSQPLPNSFLPGNFAIQYMSSDSTIVVDDSIYLLGYPVDNHLNFDGTYNVLTNDNGIITVSNSDCLSPLSGNNAYERTQPIPQNNFKITSVFPNPASESLYFKIDNEVQVEMRYSIVDAQGHVVMQREMEIESGTNTQEIRIDHLPVGLYFIRIDGIVSNETYRFLKI